MKCLGADEVLDYRSRDGSVEPEGPFWPKYDVVVHCTVSIHWSTFEPNLGPHGKVIDVSPGPASLMTSAPKKPAVSTKTIVPLMLIPRRESLEFLVGLVKEGKLKTVIDSKHTLSEAEEASAKSIDGHATGKTIVGP